MRVPFNGIMPDTSKFRLALTAGRLLASLTAGRMIIYVLFGGIRVFNGKNPSVWG